MNPEYSIKVTVQFPRNTHTDKNHPERSLSRFDKSGCQLDESNEIAYYIHDCFQLHLDNIDYTTIMTTVAFLSGIDIK